MFDRLRHFLWPRTESGPLLRHEKHDKSFQRKLNEFLEWEKGLLYPLLHHSHGEDLLILPLSYVPICVNISRCLQGLLDFGSEGCFCINRKMPSKDSPYFSICKILFNLDQVFQPQRKWLTFVEYGLKDYSWPSEIAYYLVTLYSIITKDTRHASVIAVLDDLSNYEEICFNAPITQKEWPFRYLITFVKLLLIYRAHVALTPSSGDLVAAHSLRITTKPLTQNRTWK